MDVNVRNKLYFDYTDTIRRVMWFNRILLYALRLEKEDVFQELSIVALMAIESFDPSLSDSMEEHVRAKLQYAVLDMKRYQSPGGLTRLDGARPALYSTEYSEELGHPLSSPFKDELDANDRLHKALTRLEPKERESVLLYLKGYTLRKKEDKSAFASAMDTSRILERLFRVLNMEHPADYKARSLSVSDVVSLPGDDGERFYYCDVFGFREVTFTPKSEM